MSRTFPNRKPAQLKKFPDNETMQSMKSVFFSHVRKLESGCWIFGASTLLGEPTYGHFVFKGKYRRAHRFSYALHNGRFNPRLCVLHKCDNRPCVNPDHLFLGTREVNNHDMIAKGRYKGPGFQKQGFGLPGEKHHCAKATDEKVRIIRSEYKPYIVTAKMLAERLGIPMTTVQNIVRDTTWKHVGNNS